MIESIKGNYNQFLTNNNIFIATPKNINNLLDICKDDLINKVKYIVLDEADKFFDYGFAELVSEILDKFKDKYSVTKCFFSATILESLGELITTQFFDSIKISIGLSNIPARHIEQEFIYCTNEEGKLIGIRNLFKGKIEFPILIFVEGIKKLNSIYECIKYEIQNISLIHSKMSKQEREKQITKFRLGETWVLICSDLLARGVDFKNVKTVINYDCPYRPVNYIHRIGRTGRAGKTGKAITFVIDDDVNKLKSISRMINNMIKETPGIVKCPQWLIKLSQKNSENKNGDKEENMKENK
jgi:ATP-dependent RNA helicase DDX52/ROK1